MNRSRDRESPGPEHRGRSFSTAFVVGCPRSGTTWVQLLLAEHEDVVTAPETHIFSFYLSHLQRQWNREHEREKTSDQGKAGLCQLLSRDQFDELCHDIAYRVLSHIASRDPGASTVVEKSPQHARHAEWISRLFPDASIVHVIRDPRDAVSSIISASQDWGKDWAPRHPVDAARMWKSHVAEARRAESSSANYTEIHYEDLKEDPVEQVVRLYGELDLSNSREECVRAVEACRLEKLQNEAQSSDRPLPGEGSPEGFFRKGKAGGWKDELTTSTVRVIERVCGDEMTALGYQPVARTGPGTRARILIHDILKRIRESLDWQLQRLSRWV